VYQQGFLNRDRQFIVDAVQFAFRASELISTALQLATFAVFPSIHDEALPPSLPHTHSTLQVPVPVAVTVADASGLTQKF
jgi:hypothetical protein